MVNRRKILYLVTKSVWGGAGKYTYELAAHAARLNFDVAVGAGGQGALAAKLRNIDVPYFEIEELGRDIAFARDIRAFFNIVKIFFRFRPDIFHASSPKAALLGGMALFLYRLAFFRFGARSVYTVHGWVFSEPRPRWQQKFLRALSHFICLFYGAIIVLSRNDHETAIAYAIAPKDKLSVIPNGIDPKEITFLERPEARKKLLEPDLQNRFIIGSIGEFTKNKGYRHLLEAFASVKRTLHDRNPQSAQPPHLLLIGWGEEFAALGKKAEQLKIENDVTFVTNASPASPYLGAFDIFVLPSLKEGLPYTLLEAGLAARPVIATDVGGNSDIIKHEKTGLLVPPANPAKIVSALERFLANPSFAQECGDRLRDHILKNFALSKMLEKTFATY